MPDLSRNSKPVVTRSYTPFGATGKQPGPAPTPPQNVRKFKQEDQPRLRLGTTAPNFKADTTESPIDFHEWAGDSWVLLFSHPADFTPVCTTELGAFAAMKDEFTKRNVKIIGLSTDGIKSHNDWIKDIEDVTPALKEFNYPIIADVSKEVSFLYDMVDEEGFQNLHKTNFNFVPTIRSVFIIDPKKKIRLFFTYPVSTGRNTAEILRVIDALQLNTAKCVATPVDWTPGQEVILPPMMSDEAAKKKFGEYKTVKPYLRYSKL